MTRCLNPRWQCLNPTWQNSRWLPSSSWVRMNEWSFFCANVGNDSWQLRVSLRRNIKIAESNIAKFKMAGLKMAAIIKLSQNEWVKFFMCKWWEPFLAHMSEFERKNKDGWIQDCKIQDGRIKDGCHHQVESHRMNEVFVVQMVGPNLGKCEWVWEEILRWLNPRWQNSRWQNWRWLSYSG